MHQPGFRTVRRASTIGATIDSAIMAASRDAYGAVIGAVVLATIVFLLLPAPAGAEERSPEAPAAIAPSANAAARGASRIGDPLLQVLREAGVPDGEIGLRPNGTWLRYPDPRAIRFKNRMFDDLMSDPGKIYPTVTLLARAGERFLEPAFSDTNPIALFKLAYYTGWDPFLSGFRDYNAGMSYAAKGPDPLLGALEALWKDSGRIFDFYSNEQAADWPSLRDQLRAEIAPIDTSLQRVLAQAIWDLIDARQWHRRAFRQVDMARVLAVWNVRDWPATQTDGSEFFPQIEEISGGLDQAALVTSSRKAVFAAGRLSTALRAWKKAGGTAPAFASARLRPDPKIVKPEEGKLSAAETELYTEKNGTRSRGRAEAEWDLWTPAGRIVLAGTGADEHEERDVLLLVDLGGNDLYREPVGATSSLLLPVSVAVDLGGDDRYEAADEMTATQGSGIFGTGVLVDLEGNDRYTAGRSSQGYGFFGTGLLADFAGNDVYTVGSQGQGAGFWGVGILAEREGDDLYLMDGDGQGYGGIGGVGTLIDRAGNDTYTAEPDSRKVPRPDYTHSMKYRNASNGQGSGMGRRGDMTDGHAWAGGMGNLIDLEGNDQYLSGNWSEGAGYWYGMGFLYDKSGNDLYRATTFSQASGAHFCIGALLDDGGNDTYEGLEDARTGLGFGHDYTVSILFDRAGDDTYRYPNDGLGEAINTSQTFLIDGGGSDTYVLNAGANGLGSTNFSAANWPPPLEANYQMEATQIGLFLDLGGSDTYLEREAKTGSDSRSAVFMDGATVQRPADPTREGDRRHFGIFRDVEGSNAGIGTVGDMRWFRRRVR